MGREQGPEYYDAHLERVSEPLETSPWLDVYSAAATLLPEPEAAGPIADIGCGTGRFARLLQMKGYRRYWGVDFSPMRVEEARRYVPEFEFTAGSVFDADIASRFADFRIFTLLEVLEHIGEDLRLLRQVPSDSLVVLSLPNYDSGGHVRHFESSQAVVNRYDEIIDFSAASGNLTCQRGAKKHKRIFILSGRRR